MRFLTIVLFLATICFADDASKLASKAGVWVGGSNPGVQVKVDAISNGVTVTLNKDKDQTPQSVGITFYDTNGNGTALELKSTGPWLWTNPAIYHTQFSGTLSPAAQSFIGFELQIPFGSDNPRIIRSDDLQKSN